MLDLNSLITPGTTWTLNRAYAINDANQIVVHGTLNGQSGQPHGFLLTPIPEPTTVTLLALALFVALPRRR